MENKGVRKGTWTNEEDVLLRNCIEHYGEGNWHRVPIRAGLNRCRKSCRLRWLNYLRPNLKRGYFTKEEVDLIVRMHRLLGNRWSLIAGRIPGRTANDVKNFWNTHIVRKSSSSSSPPVESSCRGESAQKTITNSNIIRPRPLIFSRLLHAPASSSEVRRTDETNGRTLESNKISSSSASLSKENDNQLNDWANSVEVALNSQPLSFSEEELDEECTRWWSSLLDITENYGGIPPAPFSGDCGGITTSPVFLPESSDHGNFQIDEDGFE